MILGIPQRSPQLYPSKYTQMMLTSCHHYLPDEEIFANRSSQAECLQQVSFNSAGGYDGW